MIKIIIDEASIKAMLLCFGYGEVFVTTVSQRVAKCVSYIKINSVRSEVLTAMSVKITIFS
jgi:hypothetical protein